MNKLFGTLFALSSIAMIAMVLMYIAVLAPAAPDGGWVEKTEYLRSNWSLYASHWRIEFLAVALTAFTSLYFSRRNSMWYLVAVGHLFYLSEYPLMIAGYLEAGTEAEFSTLNEMAVFIFAGANMLWLFGMIGVYAGESGWLRVLGMALSTLAALAFLALFLGLIGMGQAAIAGGPALLLYLVNAWYGLKVLSREHPVATGH